jgi:hypothetical protein
MEELRRKQKTKEMECERLEMVDSRRETGKRGGQTVQKSTCIREQKGEGRQKLADRRWIQKRWEL